MDRQLRDVTEGCRIRIDKEGKWFYEGCAIINPLVLRAFCEALETDEHGRHRIVISDELCYIEVEDTPFVISAIRGDPTIGLYIRLNTLETYPLDPTKLSVLVMTTSCMPYYPIGMKVRFTGPAYYSLALLMEQDETGTIVLKIRDTIYPICPGE